MCIINDQNASVLINTSNFKLHFSHTTNFKLHFSRTHLLVNLKKNGYRILQWKHSNSCKGLTAMFEITTYGHCVTWSQYRWMIRTGRNFLLLLSKYCDWKITKLRWKDTEVRKQQQLCLNCFLAMHTCIRTKTLNNNKQNKCTNANIAQQSADWLTNHEKQRMHKYCLSQ